MTANTAILTLLQLVAVISGVYFLFSKSLYRVSVALFLQGIAISGITLALGFRSLSLVLFFWALVTTLLFLAFSSSIVGDLNHALQKSETKKGLLAYVGLVIGALLCFGFLWALRKQGLALSGYISSPGIPMEELGKNLLEDQVVVFHLMGFLLLIVVLGASTLRRRIDYRKGAETSD